MQQWHYLSDTQDRIALREGDLQKMAASGIIRSQTMVWKEGMGDWVSCGEVMPELFEKTPGSEESADLTSLAQTAAPLAATGGWVRSSGLACYFLAILIFTGCAELIIRRPDFFTSGSMAAIVLKNTTVVMGLALGGLSVWLGLASNKLARALPSLNAVDGSIWDAIVGLETGYHRVAGFFLLCLLCVAILGSLVYLFL